MRKLGRSSDSLELLLDTVCSMFGAILLIAILVALMAQTVKTDRSGEDASAEMLKRKIATAEADLAETRRLTDALAVPADNPAGALAAERKQVEFELSVARAQRDHTSAELQGRLAQQTEDVSAEWNQLSEQMRDLRRREEALENDIKTQNENSTRLDARVIDLSKQIHTDKNTHIVTLRFPKERARTKRSLAILCKFGKIYPVTDLKDKKNEESIDWTPKGEDEIARPIAARGWTVAGDKAAISHLLNDIPKNEVYVAFYVFPDSFDAFHALRDQVVAAQIDFGVHLERADSIMIWGETGSAPPPL